MNSGRNSPAFAALALGWLLLSAHAFPDHSDPRVGSRGKALAEIRIWFDSELEPLFSSIAVLDANAARVDRGDARVDAQDHALLRVGLSPLAPGKYTVQWKAVAHDGHPSEGQFSVTFEE